MSKEDLQEIPARHGTATFVPKGSTIKIVNSSGTQVIDTWAFVLPEPPKSLNEGAEKSEKGAEQEDEKKEEPKPQKKEEPAKQEKKAESPNVKKGRKSKDDMGLPSQAEAEAATAKGVQEGEKQVQQSTPQKAGWSSYLPSLRGSGKKQQPEPQPSAAEKQETDEADKAQQKKNSRTWGSYLSTGEGFTSYLPSKGAISAFAASHQRDTTKSYAEQLAEFSKTPVGAASLSALTGSGATSSLYAGYSAWNNSRNDNPAMEYLSLPHTRATTCHLIPRVNDVLVSNLREPMMTLIEDTSSGRHDTLIAACDPQRYKELGVENWEEHGSCAENLVLALKELNERAGLKGPKGIGADVTINSVPAPFNLFMNIPWQGDKGELTFAAPDEKEGVFVRLRAERDVVVVMSACPQDMLEINGTDKLPQDGHFTVETPDDDSEEETDVKKKLEEATEKKKPRGQPRKLGSSAGSGSKRPSIKPEEVPLPDESKEPKASEDKSKLAGNQPKPAENKSKPAENKPKATEAKKANDTPAATSGSNTPAAPAATKPKGKPKKLVDPATGERKKPKKLEKRGSQAPTPSNTGSPAGS